MVWPDTDEKLDVPAQHAYALKIDAAKQPIGACNQSEIEVAEVAEVADPDDDGKRRMRPKAKLKK
ncbi:hypothetical protein [Undibacterium sp. TJN19]|uniref:hypothetical protein n=1 Tax=Undibacterium sp. TJN19 TaxID=3413055 RepID=UPI003BF3C6EF